ncbi:MAG: PepSY domain-containing protein, partial [Methylococcales bacterium]
VDESGSAYLGLEPFEDPATGQPRELGFNQLVLDAANGKELGRRTVGGLPTGRDNLMAFIYDLHMNLALATIGGWILGIVALVWTVDCFVGFYLTLPARRRKPARRYSLPHDTVGWGEVRTSTFHGGWGGVGVPLRQGSGQASSPQPTLTEGKGTRNFRQRWKPAWRIKWRGSAFRINFDLHRAGGLWLWLALFVLAWSSVGFMLDEVYRPVMGLFFDMPVEEAPTAAPPTGTRQPMGWLVAQATADRLMREQGRLHGFRVIWPNKLSHKADRQRYLYRVRSSADVDEMRGRTWLEPA